MSRRGLRCGFYLFFLFFLSPLPTPPLTGGSHLIEFGDTVRINLTAGRCGPGPGAGGEGGSLCDGKRPPNPGPRLASWPRRGGSADIDPPSLPIAAPAQGRGARVGPQENSSSRRSTQGPRCCAPLRSPGGLQMKFGPWTEPFASAECLCPARGSRWPRRSARMDTEAIWDTRRPRREARAVFTSLREQPLLVAGFKG